MSCNCGTCRLERLEKKVESILDAVTQMEHQTMGMVKDDEFHRVVGGIHADIVRHLAELKMNPKGTRVRADMDTYNPDKEAEKLGARQALEDQEYIPPRR